MTVSSKRVWFALAIVYVVWGSTYLGIRVAVRTIPPLLMAGTRFMIAGAVLYAFSIRRGDARADPIGPRQWRAAALIGGLLLACGNGGVSWAEQHVPTGVAALIIAGVPLWMALIAAAHRRERIRRQIAAGLAVGFAGTALLLRVTGANGGSLHLAGLFVLVGASVCWATGSVLARSVALPKRPLVATSMEMLAGGAILLAAGVVSGELGQFHPSRVSLSSVVGMAYLIVFGSWVAFTAYGWLLSKASTSLVSTYAYVNPVIAVLLGVAFLHEHFTGVDVAAAALIVTAVALIVLAQQDRRPLVDANVRSAA